MNNRLVVFSDIQGNSIALQAMFDYLKKFSDFDSLNFICLGDIASGYAPNRVIDSLRAHQVNSVKGNMDDVILNPEPYTGDDDSETRFNEIDFWCNQALTDENRHYLQDAVPFISESCYCFTHGSPSDYNHALNFDTAQIILSEQFPSEISVLFTGHKHQQFMIPVGDKVLICPVASASLSL